MKVLEVILVVGVLIGLTVVIISFIGETFLPNEDWCDYDSCTQEATYGGWKINGTDCFNYSNPECQDFLRFWDACQNYKNRLGVC